MHFTRCYKFGELWYLNYGIVGLSETGPWRKFIFSLTNPSLMEHMTTATERTMTTSSNGNIFRVTGPFCGEVTGHQWIPLPEASDAELLCFLWSAPWINGWVNNHEAGDLTRHCSHYDVVVMTKNRVHPLCDMFYIQLKSAVIKGDVPGHGTFDFRPSGQFACVPTFLDLCLPIETERDHARLAQYRGYKDDRLLLR